MKRASLLLVLVFLLLLTACAPQGGEQQITEATKTGSPPTNTAIPTDTPTLTPTPTDTDTPTPTFTPTYTPTPTETPLPTDTQTPEPSDTPEPTDTPEAPPSPTPCGGGFNLLVRNKTGSSVTIYMFGQCNYIFTVPPGDTYVNVQTGEYNFNFQMCGSSFNISARVGPNWYLNLDCD